ncbi:MAG: hypothetical protein M1830_009963 [Pleopsidium flavum]|nr:MAG: hypothetical protein M1830_009963 [Pleopsidium flavum]
MSRFYFGDSSSGSDLSDDNLPYPKPLARSAFLAPTFDPTTFLSTLHNRHQTLEDLRAELRTRSQELNKELLDLVNENYQDFLSLGQSLKGGEEKVEEVRVGLLGFSRDVEGLRDKVGERKQEVGALLHVRAVTRKQVMAGRKLLEVDQRLEELEARLMVDPNGNLNGEKGSGDEDGGAELSDGEDDSEEEGMGNAMSAARLQRHVQQYLYIKHLMAWVDVKHPFLVKQEERLLRLRNTLLLDLSTALKQAKGVDEPSKARLLKVLGIYREMGEKRDALKVLKELK